MRQNYQVLTPISAIFQRCFTTRRGNARMADRDFAKFRHEVQMKSISKLAISLLAGIAIGGAALSALYAQARPPAYTIAEIEVIDPPMFQDFAKRNAAGVKAAGGRFLALRGRIVTSEGTPPKGIAVIAWDDLDKAVGYFTSATFKELIPLRDKGAKVRLFHVEGLATGR
jgi:uncharacterized protein (DUF1330 family)